MNMIVKQIVFSAFHKPPKDWLRNWKTKKPEDKWRPLDY